VPSSPHATHRTMPFCLICFSDEPVEDDPRFGSYYQNANKFQVGMQDALCKDPGVSETIHAFSCVGRVAIVDKTRQKTVSLAPPSPLLSVRNRNRYLQLLSLISAVYVHHRPNSFASCRSSAFLASPAGCASKRWSRPTLEQNGLRSTRVAKGKFSFEAGGRASVSPFASRF
jgi:hypothetical protein